MVQSRTIETPLGGLIATATPLGITTLQFEPAVKKMANLESQTDSAEIEQTNDKLNELEDAVAGYFRDPKAYRFRLALDIRGSKFQQRVWAELRELRPGTTTTYGAIASRLGLPRGARAVGTAIGNNPILLLIPCHRVVGANGRLSGYSGGIQRKRMLLEREGGLLAL